MSKVLVGHTGFVGSNLDATASFDARYNSTNIEEAYGTHPDLLVYAGVRAEKFTANADPEGDRASTREALENIERIGAKRVVLISTVDVYPVPRSVDEREEIDASLLEPYGANRLELEQGVEASCRDSLIVRLPALFGRNLKKNFLYDLLHPVPSALSGGLYDRFSRDELVAGSYRPDDTGFYRLLPGSDLKGLAAAFESLGFDTSSFTDSRSRFQFFDLSLLWSYVERALGLGIGRLNCATGPVAASEVYRRFRGAEFVNELAREPFDYDFRSAYANDLGGTEGYLYGQDESLERIVSFLEGGGTR